MAIYANASNQVAALKELYDNPSEYLKDLVYKNNPFMALCRKDESADGFAGKYIPVPVIFSNPQGRSATFATAQTNQTATADISFFVYRVRNYQLVTIENELMEATASNAGAFIDQAKLQVDTGLRNLGNDIARQMFGLPNQQRGTISGSVSTGAITLTIAADIVNFEVGQALVTYSVSGSTPTQSTGADIGYVISVNRGAGTLVVSTSQGGNAATPTNWDGATFPYLAVEGDILFSASGLATANSLQLSGLAAWLPESAPSSSDSFWGVNRSQDVTRLAGVRYDGSSMLLQEALVNGANLVAREGGRPDMCFMSFESYAALENELGSKVQYVSVRHEEADIAFEALRVHTPYGPVSVIPDRNCPPQTAFLLQMDTIKLRSLGKAPHILTYGNLEGLEGIRVGNADAVEVRMAMYGNLIINAPGWNCRIKLAS
jgi:hypothetical protein